ncbi:MAG: PLP-dependent aminotransferase family protein [Clostridiales bacterium]|nr:PLP-dependent aminotransferase family protein [Clostridiales bacterium]
MELLVPIDTQSKKPLYEQIYEYIRGEIRAGRMQAGSRLPSTRVLADHLKVSRSTTQMAYDQLLAEGYIGAVPCRGYFVGHLETLVEMETLPEPSRAMRMQEVEDEEEIGGRETADGWIDFSPRGIDLDSFPYNTWRKLSKDTLVDDNKEFFHSGNPQGEPGLREAIGRYLHGARGVNCRPEQIIVGAGSEYLWMLLGLILGTGHCIAMENPTYKQAYRVFHSLGYEVCPVEMDASGMSTELLTVSGASVAYVMPSHQYPTGIVMPVGRRQELLHWANAGPERYLIEDDYDSEFRYRGKPVPALQGLDRHGRVIYLGTFSKSIAPAIRVSYMVLPEKLLQIYHERAGFYASTVSRIDQNILYQFIERGFYERHLNRMRTIYKGKHDALISAIRPLEDDFDLQGEHAGLHILLTDRRGRGEKELIDRAAAAGVRVYGISGYYIHPECNHRPCTVVLGYATLSEAEIVRGAGLLATAWSVC